MHVVVVGAGAFGGWTAFHLLDAGAKVTLVDAWGPGNARSSSGGETRALRAVYGSDRAYSEWAVKALGMWQRYEAEWNETLYRRTGALWMVGNHDRYVRASMTVLVELGLQYEELAGAEASKRFPQINFDSVEWALLEHEAGYLHAAHACRAVKDRFVGQGGRYIQSAAAVDHDQVAAGKLDRLMLSDGDSIQADQFVFACGPWLGKLFPQEIGSSVRPSRQEVYFFGTPAGSSDFHDEKLPVWLEFGAPMYYGFPATASHGFKITNDARGDDIDPSTADRAPTEELVRQSAQYMAYRFPALAGAPLIEARVCQYANSPDGHFIIDRHPTADNVWLVGGGSGHGFKLGPALGEFVAHLVAGDEDAHPFFSLARFRKQ